MDVIAVNITPYILIEEFKDFSPKSYNLIDKSFSNFKVLENEIIDKDTLYLTDVTKYMSLSKKEKEASFILVDTHLLLGEIEEDKLVNLIVIEESISKEKLINELSDLFKKYNELQMMILTMLYQGHNLETLLLNIYKATNIEMLLNDAKGATLFRNSNSYKYYPQQTLTSYSIREGKKILGSLSLMYNNNLSKEYQLSLFPLLCELLAEKLDDFFNAKKDAFYQLSKNILESIISDKNIDEEGAYKHLKTINWALEDRYKLILLVSSKYESIQKITSFLNEKYSTSSLIIKDDAKYLILVSSTKANTKILMNEIRMELENNDDTKVFSSVNFLGLSSIKNHYKFLQMLNLRILEPGVIDMSTDTLKVLYLIYQGYNTEVFIRPEILELKKHDEENDTDFLETLYAYISKERSLVNTAELLNVHRNTIVYRVGKIEEIINLDLDDSNIRYHVLISIILLKGDILF